jgi:predicted PurR-regulated permease PerM
MLLVDQFREALSRPARFSYFFMIGLLVLTGVLRLGPMLVAALFSYLVLSRLNSLCRWSKWVSVVVFVILVSGAAYALAHFTNETIRALPKIADSAVPSIIHYARQHQIELPFTDYDSLKDTAVGAVKTRAREVAKFAGGATTELLLLIFGVVIATAFFLHPKFDLPRKTPLPSGNLYFLCTEQLAARFHTFFRSFSMVLGAQIIISAINTLLTTFFVVAVDLPYPLVILGITFLCGLVPVVGNLISNTIIVGVGFTISPKVALSALIFLVLIHKLEYFLNSKIIGHRIHNPVWLTLLAIVVGERLMGVPGVILAPVLLHYLKTETALIQLDTSPRLLERS